MDKIAVLNQCTIDGNIVKLPPIQLERKLYQDAAKALELIGGKWKGGKVAGFVFPTDPTELLEKIRSGDKVNLKKEYQFFETPEDIITMMFSFVNFKEDMKILEPSAGRGAIINAIFKYYPFITRVDYCETMDINQHFLDKIKGAVKIGSDFLQVNASGVFDNYYDAIIANPPFSKNQDIQHIRKMYDMLKPGGILVSIASSHWDFSNDRESRSFREWLLSIRAFTLEIPAKAFASSGTNVETRMIIIEKP